MRNPMNMYSTRSPICIIFILLTLTGTAFAADTTTLTSDKYTRTLPVIGNICSRDALTQEQTNHEDTTVGGWKYPIPHDTSLDIKVIRNIILDYYGPSWKMMKHFSIKADQLTGHAITDVQFSDNACQLIATIIQHANPDYRRSTDFAFIEGTGPLPSFMSGNPSLHQRVEAYSPHKLYKAVVTGNYYYNTTEYEILFRQGYYRVTLLTKNAGDVIILYRNTTKLLANALASKA